MVTQALGRIKYRGRSAFLPNDSKVLTVAVALLASSRSHFCGVYGAVGCVERCFHLPGQSFAPQKRSNYVTALPIRRRSPDRGDGGLQKSQGSISVSLPPSPCGFPSVFLWAWPGFVDFSRLVCCTAARGDSCWLDQFQQPLRGKRGINGRVVRAGVKPFLFLD